ncbi:biotin/lipoyl-binding protein [bacterium]|nr:biotin/lipoyl-binding protein [bacterium]PJA74975.1 MAG: hypothetical protein CO151_07900 [bacterium CG_4_9_14_3_um_filter_65_15]
MRLTKRYTLTVDGVEISAEMASEDGRTEIRIADTEAGTLDARPVLGGRSWSLRLGDRHHLIHLTPLDGKGGMAATVNGRPVPMTVLDELRALALSEVEARDGGGVLVADIPGLVVEIKVKVGQRVAPGEPVIVVEAMKMQNELTAGIDGVVTEIPVVEGQAVNPGDALVLIEPQE